MIDAWITFWGWLLVLVLGIFAALAIAVTVGGISDIRALLSKMDEQHKKKERDKTGHPGRSELE